MRSTTISTIILVSSIIFLRIMYVCSITCSVVLYSIPMLHACVLSRGDTCFCYITCQNLLCLCVLYLSYIIYSHCIGYYILPYYRPQCYMLWYVTCCYVRFCCMACFTLLFSCILLSFKYEFCCRGMYNVVSSCVVYRLLSLYIYYLVMYYFVFHILLSCVVMYYIILYSILLQYIVIQCVGMFYIVLSFTVLHYIVSLDQHLSSSVVFQHLRNTATSPLILRDRSLHITVNNTTSAMTPSCPTPDAPPHRFLQFFNPHRHTTPFPVYNT